MAQRNGPGSGKLHRLRAIKGVGGHDRGRAEEMFPAVDPDNALAGNVDRRLEIDRARQQGRARSGRHHLDVHLIEEHDGPRGGRRVTTNDAEAAGGIARGGHIAGESRGSQTGSRATRRDVRGETLERLGIEIQRDLEQVVGIREERNAGVDLIAYRTDQAKQVEVAAGVADNAAGRAAESPGYG